MTNIVPNKTQSYTSSQTTAKMFDYNPKSYINDIISFTEKHIAAYDSDKNGTWSENEFITSKYSNKEEADITINAHNEYDGILDIYTKFINKYDTDKDRKMNTEEFSSAYTKKPYSELTQVQKDELATKFQEYNFLNSDSDNKTLNADELAYSGNYKTYEGLNDIRNAYFTVQDLKQDFSATSLDGDTSSITAKELSLNFLLADVVGTKQPDGYIDYNALNDIEKNPQEYNEFKLPYWNKF